MVPLLPRECPHGAEPSALPSLCRSGLTDRIDAMAASGIRLTRYYVQATCTPSRQ